MRTAFYIGVTASVFTAISLIPQLAKLLKEKDATNISFGMLFVLFIGLSMWVWYGFLREDWIIVISNAFSLAVNAVVIALSFRYKNTST